jgi:glycosyltransferase involved in cell wall biosynthesis
VVDKFCQDNSLKGYGNKKVKIILLATTSWNLYNSRMNLAKALKSLGHEVILLSPRDEFSSLLEAEGFRWVHLPLKPRGKNVFQETYSLLFLIWFYIKTKPALVNHFTPKGVIYGSIAAKIARIRRNINTITGLGYIFSGNTKLTLQKLVIQLYKISLKNTVTIFQNRDDYNYFLSVKITDPSLSFLIRGSGVDMTRFDYSDEPSDRPPVVMLPSRFVEEKGIRYFVEASRILQSKKIPVRFVIVGKPENDQPTSIKHAEVTNWITDGLVEWWGWHNQMEKIYPLTHIVCLPTYYMEGIPKSLIEAAASGRPLIATDVPGCREICQDGENGFLVRVKDSNALAKAIMTLATNDSLRKQMGKRSREIALAEFSMKKVLKEYFELYKLS